MKKDKKHSTNKDLKPSLFKPDIKASRVTIDSKICNTAKFDELYEIIDNHTKKIKNTISLYCLNNLTKLVTNYTQFKKNYVLFKNPYLNSWEKQTLFQEVSGHYYETVKRYLSKSTYIIQKQGLSSRNNKITKVKTKLNSLAALVDNNSNLVYSQNYVLINYYSVYSLDFDIKSKLKSLNNYLTTYKKDLLTAKNDEVIKLENLIISYNKIIKVYLDVEQFALTKPVIYNRVINLVTDKKLRLLKKVKLGVYETGTHARHIDNAQISIIKDLNNNKYQYFLQVRKNSTLTSHEPRFKETKLSKITKEEVEELKALQKIKDTADYEIKLAKYKADNFIYLPLIFNQYKLDQIDKKLEDILSKNNPQILLKTEQLRKGKNSRKIHLIFKYEEANKLGEIIEHNLYVEPNDENTLGLDVNLKHNLLADSKGNFYDEILKKNNKNNLVNNINEIVLLQSKPILDRTEKEKYRYEKLLRANESLIKTYLSGLIKNWKVEGINHLVMEDLNFLDDKSYYEYAGVKIKYSRLARLLRLSQIKLWVSSMAEKQGLFTHLVNPAYTSQECSKCHLISPLNRLNQEIFKCVNKNCNHEMNADNNAALCIKNRKLNKKLSVKLNDNNVYRCSKPKIIYYRNIKKLIDEFYNYGVVTELLPENTISRIFTKEASPLYGGVIHDDNQGL